MKNSSLTLKEVRTTLKEMSLIGSVPVKISNVRRPSRGLDEMVVSSPGDVGPACATMFFTKSGNFVEAVVFEPGRCNHCLEEGLTMDQALDESMRYVDTVGDVHKFLQRKPYEWDGKRKWLKRVMKA